MRSLPILGLCLLSSCSLDSAPEAVAQRAQQYPDWNPTPRTVAVRNADASVAPSGLTSRDSGVTDAGTSTAGSRSAPQVTQTPNRTLPAPMQSAAASATAGASAAAGASAVAGSHSPVSEPEQPRETLPTGSGAPPNIDTERAQPASRTPASQPQEPPAPGASDGNDRGSNNAADKQERAPSAEEQDKKPSGKAEPEDKAAKQDNSQKPQDGPDQKQQDKPDQPQQKNGDKGSKDHK